MKKMLSVTGLLALTLVLPGCGKNEAVKAYEDFATDVCACKDMECFKQMAAKGDELMQKYAEAKGSDADVKAINDAATKVRDCSNKLVGGDATPADGKPATPAPATAVDAPK